jgi:hypothetical protein
LLPPLLLFYDVNSYMQESGFVHSAFTFVYESMLGRSNIRNADKSIPPGALITFLQKGLQYVGIEESLQREGSKSRKAGANDLSSLSLLAPQTISALTRENPPIQLNVPPATAAAAVRARLAAEAKLEADRKAVAVKEAADEALSNGSNKIVGPASIPPQPAVDDPNQLTRTAMGAQAAQVAAASAMSQLQQTSAVRQKPAETAGAAAMMAQQRRNVASDMAALQEEQQRQQHMEEMQNQQNQQNQHLHQQLQLQQQLQQEQQLQNMHPQQMSQTDGMNASATVQAPPALASVAQLSGNKRPASSKKGPRSKGKPSKQQRQNTPPPESLNIKPQSNQGFASLEEAVARLEAANANGVAEKIASSSSHAVPMDTEENDQHAKSSALPAHAKSSALPSHAKSSALPAHAELGSMPAQDFVNGKHGQGAPQRLANGGQDPRNLTAASGMRLMPPHPNGPRSNPQENQHRQKEGGVSSKVDSTIDREDELTNADPSEVLELKMHSSEVFMCAWNPIFTDMIATGSGDASARIWQMGGATATGGLGPVRLLPHGTGPRDRKNKDVTTLEWSSDGKLLATGSYDGVARVWSRNGALVHTLRGHKGPIFSLKWNRRGNYLLSGSYDKTTIVWDVSGSTGFVEQQFNDHQAPALDVDWKDDTTFASCSTDKTVHICRVGMPRPLKTYTGHTDEVNAVKWDPSGTLLASCSDDCTAKVWDVGSDRKDPMQDFKSHQQEIYTVKW